MGGGGSLPCQSGQVLTQVSTDARPASDGDAVRPKRCAPKPCGLKSPKKGSKTAAFHVLQAGNQAAISRILLARTALMQSGQGRKHGRELKEELLAAAKGNSNKVRSRVLDPLAARSAETGRTCGVPSASHSRTLVCAGLGHLPARYPLLSVPRNERQLQSRPGLSPHPTPPCTLKSATPLLKSSEQALNHQHPSALGLSVKSWRTQLLLTSPVLGRFPLTTDPTEEEETQVEREEGSCGDLWIERAQE